MAFTIDSCLWGHHVSKLLWSPTIREELLCKREEGSLHAVCVSDKSTGTVVSHIPRKISAVCSLFLWKKWRHSMHGYGEETVLWRPLGSTEDLPSVLCLSPCSRTLHTFSPYLSVPLSTSHRCSPVVNLFLTGKGPQKVRQCHLESLFSWSIVPSPWFTWSMNTK